MRSATATEIHDYLRLLYARIGRTLCPQCGDEIRADQVQNAVDRVLTLPPDTKIQITFPLGFGSLQEKIAELNELKIRGFYRILVENELIEWNAEAADRIRKGNVAVLVDRLKVGKHNKSRLADSLDLAFREGSGKIEVLPENLEALRFSRRFECARCDLSFIKPQPRLFSFNNPFGACPTCRGFGEVIEIDRNLVIPDQSKSLREGAIAPWNTDRVLNFRR